MYFAGVDIGSLTTKVCIIDAESKLVAHAIKRTTVKIKEVGEDTFRKCLRKASLKPSDVRYIVATGYGRNLALSTFADEKITEITCHSRGARFLFPKCRTVIDVGGQDSKVMRLDDSGRVLRFTMNDKCAAGTGRFLEVMAEALGVKLEKMGEISLKSGNRVQITSTCTVFAESEVISLIASGENPFNIIAGLHEAIAKRISSLVRRVGGAENDVVMTGGVAKNIGVVKALEREIGYSIHVPLEPQIVGAIGAALMAKEKNASRGKNHKNK
ncbi:TPA: 2-hydroxyglutaryl-CoA dehydratase [Candidatus Bathyarchaeota archaeon]|nr:2-hydroxyglutaryl-CoA dehydratase [Candidatus Bathyarchaeota archaeon]